MLVSGLAAPAVAEAHAAKLKTKIVYVNTAGWSYRTHWSLDTTSVPTPVARGRLLYYKPSTKKWVGYSGRPVKVGCYGAEPGLRHFTVVKAKTDRRGYFRFPLKYQYSYYASYAGSAHTRRASRITRRIDSVDTRRLPPVVTTSTVDATNTRIAVTADYLFNPFVTRGDILMSAAIYLVDSGDVDGWPRAELGTYLAEDDLQATPGVAHLECGYVVPTARLEGKTILVESMLQYGSWGKPYWFDTIYLP